jgi:hypothetical protein
MKRRELEGPEGKGKISLRANRNSLEMRTLWKKREHTVELGLKM